MGLHRGEGENNELRRCQPSPPAVRITGTGVELGNRPVRFNQTGSSVNRSARAELTHKWLATGALVPSSQVDPKSDADRGSSGVLVGEVCGNIMKSA